VTVPRETSVKVGSMVNVIYANHLNYRSSDDYMCKSLVEESVKYFTLPIFKCVASASGKLYSNCRRCETATSGAAPRTAPRHVVAFSQTGESRCQALPSAYRRANLQEFQSRCKSAVLGVSQGLTKEIQNAIT
jgi:hypothetical protein